MARLLFMLSTLVATTPLLVNADVGFNWIWPPPFGLVPSQKSIAPCGGFSVQANSTSNFLNQLRWNQTEPQISYMTRVTQDIDEDGTPGNFSELIPVIIAQLQNINAGNAQFCVPVSQTPGFRPNDTTVFQLIADTPDGIIFAVRTFPKPNDIIANWVT